MNIPKEITADDVMPYLKPYIEENIALHREINRLKNQIDGQEVLYRQLEDENRRLLFNHEDSGLDRDKPAPCKWRVSTITKGKFTGQKDTRWWCPKCERLISNWENYCIDCGQRLADREYLPEMEVKEDD